MIVDTGFLIALDRHDPMAEDLLRDMHARGITVFVPATVEAQAVRNRAAQVRLTRALDSMISVPLDRDAARKVGALLAHAGSQDVVDAHVAIVASNHPGPVVTSDPGDLAALGIHPDRLIAV